jgi:hypothetical protein
MSTTKPLPPEFADLAPWTAGYCLTNEHDRYFKLMSLSVDELRPFIEAVMPRMEAMAAYLQSLPVDGLTAEQKNLFWLLMTFIEMAHPIELRWSTTDVEDAFDPARMQFGQASRTSPV